MKEQRGLADVQSSCWMESELASCKFNDWRQATHRWQDRRVHVQLPLFPGYVLVRLALREPTPSTATAKRCRSRRIWWRTPQPLPKQEIEKPRSGLSRGLRAQPHPCLIVGRRVRIVNGPLTGMEGILQRHNGNFRVVLSVDLIQRSVVIEVNACDLLPPATTEVKGASGKDFDVDAAGGGSGA
jgi:transcription antitermination factor NusG